jgi:CPA2 family monovalent cation:H+ antiporter-2
VQINFLDEVVIIAIGVLTGGLAFSALKLPPLLGYIVAGIVLGPSGFAFIHSRDSVSVLSELGILLLLFVIGMELNLKTFRNIWGLSTLCVVGQIIVSLLLTSSLSWIFDWSIGVVLFFSFVMAISSTAVAVKVLENLHEHQSDQGQTIVGILIAQDLAIIPMILILKSIGTHLSATYEEKAWLFLILKILVSGWITASIIRYTSRRQRFQFLKGRELENIKELLPLISLLICFGSSFLSGFIGFSEAYGAFLAGIILGNTTQRAQILEAVKPIQSILLTIFFLSIGILFNWQFVYQNWMIIGSLLFLLIFFKTLINVGLLRLLRLSLKQSILVGAFTGQIGEFAFLLASVARESHLINRFDENLVVSLTVLSLLISPFWILHVNKFLQQDFCYQSFRFLFPIFMIVPKFVSSYFSEKKKYEPTIPLLPKPSHSFEHNAEYAKQSTSPQLDI